MYRTKCAMYDEVSVGNPGKVPYCAKQDKLEPDCQHCKQPCVTNADKIRQMDDEELSSFLNNQLYWPVWCDDNCQAECHDCCLKWLKEEVKENAN